MKAENPNRLPARRIFLAVLAMLAMLAAGNAFAQTGAAGRYALVVGNADYAELPDLRNPVNDASDMAAALKDLGFKVILLVDADLVRMEDAVNRLGTQLSGSPSSIGFFYYAGHGVQANGVNYLIPSDSHISGESYLRTKALAAQSVLDVLQSAGNSLNVIVLDACRDNPFGWARSGSRGLSVVGNQPPGSIIVYATGAGNTAQDGSGRNGVFTAELLRNLDAPGVEIKEVFNRTGAGVLSATLGRQTPAVYNQFFGSAYLAGGGANPPPQPPTTTTTVYQPARLVGSLLVSAESAGSLYMEGARKGELRKGGAQRLSNLEVGYYELEMRYPSGQKETKSVRVLEGREVEIAFDWKPLPPSMVEMVQVQGGTFSMGSNSGDSDEKPMHQVTVSSFLIGKYEITVGDFRRFVESTGYRTDAEKGDGAYIWNGSSWAQRKDANWSNPGFAQSDKHPVSCVSWNDATAFCNWLSEREGLQKVYAVSGTDVGADFGRNGYRLPTEAEWEYAARGGSQSLGYNYAGSDNLDQVAWYTANSGNTTYAAGMKAPNELGLYDMSGNVWEWCWDWYKNGYDSWAQTDPMGASSGGRRVNRGGSWGSSATYLRSAIRLYSRPGNSYDYLGFRVLRRP